MRPHAGTPTRARSGSPAQTHQPEKPRAFWQARRDCRMGKENPHLSVRASLVGVFFIMPSSLLLVRFGLQRQSSRTLQYLQEPQTCGSSCLVGTSIYYHGGVSRSNKLIRNLDGEIQPKPPTIFVPHAPASTRLPFTSAAPHPKSHGGAVGGNGDKEKPPPFLTRVFLLPRVAF